MIKYLFIFSILLMTFSCQQNHSSKTEDKTAKELTVQDSKSKIDSTNVQNIYIYNKKAYQKKDSILFKDLWLDTLQKLESGA